MFRRSHKPCSSFPARRAWIPRIHDMWFSMRYWRKTAMLTKLLDSFTLHSYPQSSMYCLKWTTLSTITVYLALLVFFIIQLFSRVFSVGWVFPNAKDFQKKNISQADKCLKTIKFISQFNLLLRKQWNSKIQQHDICSASVICTLCSN